MRIKIVGGIILFVALLISTQKYFSNGIRSGGDIAIDSSRVIWFLGDSTSLFTGIMPYIRIIEDSANITINTTEDEFVQVTGFNQPLESRGGFYVSGDTIYFPHSLADYKIPVFSISGSSGMNDVVHVQFMFSDSTIHTLRDATATNVLGNVWSVTMPYYHISSDDDWMIIRVMNSESSNDIIITQYNIFIELFHLEY